MKHAPSQPSALAACLLAALLATQCKTTVAEPPPVPETSGQKDTSGTNPTVLLRTASAANEYAELPGGGYLDTLTLRYNEPFADGRMNLAFKAPMAWTDVPSDESGLLDPSVKWNWVASLSKADGWVVNTELIAPLGDDRFSADRWVLAPGVAYVRFLSSEVILAPALVHNASVTDDGDGADVSRTVLDLYVVYRPAGERWWVTSDLAASVDWENDDATPASWELNFGRNLGRIGGAACNAYLRPGIGLGADRTYDGTSSSGSPSSGSEARRGGDRTFGQGARD